MKSGYCRQQKMKNHNVLLALLAVLFAAVLGCSSLVPLNRDDLAQLKKQSEIGAVRHEPAAFYGDVGIYGLIGWGMSLSAGKEMREIYGLEDPARAIEEKFIQNLRGEFKGVTVRAVDQPLSDDDLAAVKKTYGGRWVFDFKTLGWGSAAEGDVEFTVRVRLIRNDDGKIVWQGLCHYKTEDAKWEPLTANGAVLLKAKLQAGVTPCATQLWSQFQ
jgi:hypothetical protein